MELMSYMGMNVPEWIPLWGPYAFLALIVWGLIWKALALWTAARRNEPWWFIVMLIVNTLGILEIVYLFVITKTGIPKLFSASNTASDSSGGSQTN